MSDQVFYITTPIYYVNDLPHIGHAYTTVAADFISRYRRLAGEEVFFLTGTDEHGQSVLRAAEEHDRDPQDWADELVKRFKQVWERLDISYDDFIRTTEPRHTEPAGKFFADLHEKGEVYLGRYEGLYCVSCETFYREIELVNGLCPVHERPLEKVEEDNYFFKLSAYQDRLLQLYSDDPGFVRPEVRMNEVRSFVESGLEDISISRTSFKWGIPLPWDQNHVMYVWVDALQNYITAAGYRSDEERFQRIWPANFHLIGKEILRQHAVIWPAMLMAADLPPPKTVFAHGHLTVGGKKMSKTNLTGISPHEIIDEIGSDAYRYHFLREGSFAQDGNFSWESMIARYNADLANDLGNFVSRTLALVESNFEGLVPSLGETTDAERDLADSAARAAKKLDEGVRALDLGSAVEGVMGFVKASNHYIDAQTPWNLAKDPDKRERLSTVLYSACEAMRQIAVMISPAMPGAADSIAERLGIKKGPYSKSDLVWGGLAAESQITKGSSLFARIEA